MAGQRDRGRHRLERKTRRESTVRLATLEETRSATVAAVTTAGDETLTAAMLAGGLITRDPNGGDRTDTTDTAEAIIEAAGLTANGMKHPCAVVNLADAAEVITLAGGTGVTVANPGRTIGQNGAAWLVFIRASSTTLSLYIL